MNALIPIVSQKVPIYCVYQKTMHTPLALGCITAFLRSYKDGALLQHYEILPDIFYSWSQLRAATEHHGQGIYLFSDYVWNQDYHLSLTDKLKKTFPKSVIIHGGPSVPNLEPAARQFMNDHPSIDVLVQGEGEVTLSEYLEELSVSQRKHHFGLIAGITYRDQESNDICVNIPRVRAKTLDHFPSAYQDEIFDHLNPKDLVAGIVETNRGCPYGCTYCDWGTRQKIRIFPLEKIESEIEWIAKNKISVLWISDANFGILPRDLEIAQKVAALKKKYGYPKQLFVNYAKNATRRVADIVSVLADSGLSTEGIISIQTRDQQTLNIIERKNIKNEKFDDLIEIFRSKKLPIASDLMLGLPGSSLETLKADSQYFFDRDIKIKIYHSQILPNAPMAHPDYMKKHEIQVDDEGFIRACSSFDRDDMVLMQRYSEIFTTLLMFGVLKYFLKYLQLEHKVLASDFIHRLTVQVYGEPITKYVAIKEVLNLFLLKFDQRAQSVEYNWRLMFTSWKAFNEEVLVFVQEQFDLPISNEMKWVLEAQENLIPSPWKTMPKSFDLTNDLEAYLQQMKLWTEAENPKALTLKPLSSFPPGKLVVSDPNGFCNFKFYFRLIYNIHIIRFELDSNLRVDQDRATFVYEEEGSILFWLHRFWGVIKHRTYGRKHYSGLGNLKRAHK